MKAYKMIKGHSLKYSKNDSAHNRTASVCYTGLPYNGLKPFYSAKGASETYETCFVPKGTKLAARFARCLFVKMSRFNKKQY